MKSNILLLILLFCITVLTSCTPDPIAKFKLGEVVLHKVSEQKCIVISGWVGWSGNTCCYKYNVRMVNLAVGMPKITGSASMALSFGSGKIEQKREPAYVVMEFWEYELEKIK